jgi:hypothetical protein
LRTRLLPAKCCSTAGLVRSQPRYPLALEGIRERFLPECTFRGRQNKKYQYAVLVAAALRGGTDPDLLDEVAWWQTDDFIAVLTGPYICGELGRVPLPPDGWGLGSGEPQNPLVTSVPLFRAPRRLHRSEDLRRTALRGRA